MSNILNSEDFGLQLYNRFPPKYREDDVKEKYALKRYMQSMSDGGYKYVIDDINRLITLIDPSKVDSKYLPILFKQFGLEIFNGIPEDYLRFLLPRLGEAWSKKGSLDVVEFITSSISGIKTMTSVTYDEKGNPIVYVRLDMDYSLSEDYNPNLEQINRILKNFVPSFCDSYIIKTYVFYDENSLKVEENEGNISIVDHKLDSGLIPFGTGNRLQPTLNNTRKILNSTFVLNEMSEYYTDPDYFKDNIKCIYVESPKIDFAEYYLCKVTLGSDNENGVLNNNGDVLNDHVLFKYEEESKLGVVMYFEDIIKPLSLESNGVKTKDELSNNMIYGHTESTDVNNDGDNEVYDNISLKYSEQSELATNDIHFEPYLEYGSVHQNNYDSYTNSNNCVLGSFYTNSLYSCDIIKKGNSEEVIYN